MTSIVRPPIRSDRPGGPHARCAHRPPTHRHPWCSNHRRRRRSAPCSTATVSGSSARTGSASRPCSERSPGRIDDRMPSSRAPSSRRLRRPRSGISRRSPSARLTRRSTTSSPAVPGSRAPRRRSMRRPKRCRSVRPTATTDYSAALDQWLALGAADFDARAGRVFADLSIDERSAGAAHRDAVGR